MQDPGAISFAWARRTAVGIVLATVATLAVMATPAAADPVLAGQWRFDEPGGQTVVDDGPQGLHGTLGASAAPAADDPLRIPGALGGGALRFDSRSSVAIADGRRLDLDTLTVEAVARGNGSPGLHRYLVAHGGVGCFAGAYGLYTAGDGGLAFYVFDGERYHVSASAPAAEVWDGNWHALAGTFDGRHVRVFVDGRQVGGALQTPAGTAIEYESMPEGTYFGTYVGTCRLPFSGELDAVRIWSGGSSPATIAEHAGVAVGAPLQAGATPEVIETAPPKSSCSVTASRTQIRAGRRAAIALRASAAGGPLRRVRLTVRRANGSRVIAALRTNAKGNARVVLRIPTSGRLRVGVVGRSSCTPAFIKVSTTR